MITGKYMSISTKFVKIALDVIRQTRPVRDTDYKSLLSRKVSAYQLRQIIIRLQRLHIDHNPRVGVCAHLLETVNGCDRFVVSTILRYAAFTWEFRSGCSTFPIPSEDVNITPAEAYVNCIRTSSMYTGRQGELRQLYVEYLINTCNDLLEGYDSNYRGF